jgi:hypothetical protein
MGGFTKLFSDIVLSSIWSEDDKTRIVWITLLATSNADGFVSASLPGLATAARVTIEECEAALAKLASPDPHSRTKDHEGRRIETVDGGWLILNYRLYRDRTSDDPNAIAVRERMRRYRERKAAEALPPAPPSGKEQNAEERSRGRSRVTLRNVTVTPTLEEVLVYASEIHLPDSEARKHFDHYTANGWRINKNPVKDWKATLRNWQRRYNEGEYKTGTRAGNQQSNRIEAVKGKYAHIGTTM